MISLIFHNFLLILLSATMISHARTPCNIFNHLSQTLLFTDSTSMREKDLLLLVCLAGLHNFQPDYYHPTEDSLTGLFGLNKSKLDLCDAISLDGDSLFEQASCFLKIRENSRLDSSRITPEHFCQEILTEPVETSSLSVKYDYVPCNGFVVIIPSEHSQRLYQILIGHETNYTRNVEYRRFTANVAYYDRNMYMNFFLDRSRHLWKKLNKTLYDLTHRPIRLTVLLMIVCFILILALRYLSSTLENHVFRCEEST